MSDTLNIQPAGPQQNKESNILISSKKIEKTETNSTQLIEKTFKQIHIKEEYNVKKILKTRETKQPETSDNEHQTPPNPARVSLVDNKDTNDQSPKTNHFKDDAASTSQQQSNKQESNHVKNNVQAINDDANLNSQTKYNLPSNNYQNLVNGQINLDNHQNDNFSHISAQPIQSSASHHDILPSGYEELDATFNQQANMSVDPNLIVNPPYGYIIKNDQNVAPFSNHAAFAQNDVTYITQPSTYDTAYGTTGPNLIGTTQLAPNQNIYGTNQIEPIYAMRTMMGHDSSIPEVLWRDPELSEVISFLSSPDPIVRANSVAYLQHISFMNDNIKKQTRLLGGITILIDLLNRDILEIQRNVCGALRNLSYGKNHGANKRAIRDAMGIQALVRSLVNNPDNEIRELSTSVLWNLSSCEDIKWSLIDEALGAIVSVIIVPYTQWFKVNISNDNQFMPSSSETHWSTVFRNSTGMLRNISSAGAYARKQLRCCEGLIESLFFIIKASISKNDVENKIVENCVCLLRNLSYRCQETQDPDYDKHFYNNNSRTNSTNNSINDSPSSPSSSTNLTSSFKPISKVTENFGCFSFARKSKSKSSLNTSKNTSNQSDQLSMTEQRSSTLLPPHHPSQTQSHDGSNTMMRTSTQINMNGSNSTLPRSNISNIPKINQQEQDLLWQTDVVKSYLALLSGCSNYETLEAAAGAIQNLAACFWQPSIDIRAAVRKEKGLPVLVELLRMDVDPVVCVVATALRNLAIDQRNKELIGKYAMPDLVSKLPNGQLDHDNASSDDTVAAVLATLHEVISNNADFARSLYETGGLIRLSYIVKNRPKFSPRVQRFTAQVLLDMWKFQELRDVYKKGGWKETHFVVKTQTSSKSSTFSVNSNTIERPIASQHADRSSSIRNLRALSSPTSNLQDDNNVVDANMMMKNQNESQPKYGIVPMTNLNGHIGDTPQNNFSALYAQVDPQRKRNGIQAVQNQ